MQILKSKSKRRRTTAEILAAKEQQLRAKQEQVEQARRLQDLEDQLTLAQARIEQSGAATQFCNNMIEAGHIRSNDHGELVVVPLEQQEQFKTIEPTSPAK